MVLGEVDEEYLLVDESAPVVHPFETEAGLDGSHTYLVQVVLQVVAVA